MIIARAVGVTNVGIRIASGRAAETPTAGWREPMRGNGAPHDDDVEPTEAELAIAFHRAALAVPLLPVPAAVVRPGSARHAHAVQRT